MTLKTQMAADAGLFLSQDDFGEEVSWYPDGAEDPLLDPVPIQFHQGATMMGQQMIAIESEAVLLVAKTAIPDPSDGASFIRADGKVWSIDRKGLRGADDVFWFLAANLDPIPTLRMN